MKFAITLDKNDFRRFNKFAIAKIHVAPKMKWKLTLFNFLYWFLLVFFGMEIYSVYEHDAWNNYEHLNRALVAFGIWFILVNIWQQIYMYLYISVAIDEKGSVLGEWEFEISDSGITESNSLCSSTFTWQCIQSAEKDKYNLYLFTDRLKALILPLSQINEEIEAEIYKNVVGDC
ncbi:YcxB family protein [Microbulbifer sp. CNSA002]|uniref:YcxB family protein n=1 Tax=unclassified Microbulbifer TaxID=2619833 RepID=UPI0039B3CB9B